MPEFRWSEIADGGSWYVNLDSRPDRRKHIDAECARVGIKPRRLRGILPDEYAGPPERIAAMLARPQRGAIGCHLSQEFIIREAARSGRNLLVLEDDVLFCDDLADRMAHVERFLAGREWDVVSLAGTVHIGPAVWHVGAHAQLPWCDCKLNRDAETTDDPRVLRMYGSWFTYAYIVNGDSAGKIIDLFDANLHRSIGIDYLFMGIAPQLTIYAFTPGCATQLDGESDIGVRQADGSRSLTTFSHFAKLGPYVFQRRAEDFDPASFNWAEARR